MRSSTTSARTIARRPVPGSKPASITRSRWRASNAAMCHSPGIRYCAVALLVAALAGCDRGPDSAASATRPEAARPTPHHADGQVRFDCEPGSRGYWGQASVSSLFERGVQVAMDENGLLANIADAPRVAPFQPWALALYEYRQRNGLKDDPTRACIAPSGPRHLHTAGGFRIIRDPTYDRMYVLFGGGNRNR